MKTKFPLVLTLTAATLLMVTPPAVAQRQLGKKKGPTSKIYLAETKGETQIMNNEKIYTARQATAFDAPGTVIETKADSHDAFVYSNGTGLYVDQNTRVEINAFVQEPFLPGQNNRADTLVEPSVSQSNVLVARGAVGICTSRLVSGSTMNYSTPEATVNIRNGRVSIESTAGTTIIDLLEGDITVRNGGKDLGGQVLRPGERATIRSRSVGQAPTITISPTPPELLQSLDDRVSVACNARKTVTFNTIERKAEQGLDVVAVKTAAAGSTPTDDSAAGADQEIVAKPTVPEKLPANITVSADRLPGGTE